MKAEDVLRARGKRIAVIGDSMADVYVHGRLEGCQDGCPKFMEVERRTVQGGQSNACLSLVNAGAELASFHDSFREPVVKTRFLVDGKIVWRHDSEPQGRWVKVENVQDNELGRLLESKPDAVYVSDYDKGFITDAFMRRIVEHCAINDIVCVVDPKRSPAHCRGAVLKCNGEFAVKWGVLDHHPGAVITHGAAMPTVFDETGVGLQEAFAPFKGRCVNHVGAGDCFGAWLTLGLAHGLGLQEAARLGHAAGRVYVQHPHNRPPWPHEIAKELDPVLGKIVMTGNLVNLRQSFRGRVVFTNGTFRLPHAGHAWLLDWSRRQGDCLVVGVNDNVSAFRQRPGEFCLPLEERLRFLCSLQSVDWVVVFGEDTPVELIKALKPDAVVKGHDQKPDDVGAEFVIAPPGPHKGHASDVIKSIRG